MICESCESTIPDDAAVCPVCGVSTALFLTKSNPKLVTQTVPDFVRKPGSGSAVKEPAKVDTAQKVSTATETTDKTDTTEKTAAAAETTAETVETAATTAENTIIQEGSVEPDQKSEAVPSDLAGPEKEEPEKNVSTADNITICMACGSSFDDNLAACPVCGVSKSLFLEKPNPKLITQTVPDFVKKPGSQSDVRQQVASDTTKTPVISNIRQDADQQPVIERSAKKANIFAYISIFLGFVIMLSNILIAQGFSGTENILPWVFIALIADFVFSCIGLADSKSIPKSKPIAIVGLIICIIDLIVLILVFWYVVLPYLMKKIVDNFPHGIPSETF